MAEKIVRKQKIELIITGVGIVILIYMFSGIFTKTRTVESPENKASGHSVISDATNFSEKNPMEEIEGIADKKPWGRNPFTFGAIASRAPGADSLELNGIVWDEYNPYAIVNNEVLKTGDVINGMTVLDIREKEIILDSGNEEYRLRLAE